MREMVAGRAEASHAQVAVAVSGVAGPSGGTPQKPVGTVCFAWGSQGRASRAPRRGIFAGDREAVRRQSVIHALEVLLEMLEERRSGHEGLARVIRESRADCALLDT